MQTLRDPTINKSKLLALIEVYLAFSTLNLDSKESVKLTLDIIKSQLSDLESFSSDAGELMAWIKQSIFSTGFSTTICNTRLLVGELIDFIEQNAPHDCHGTRVMGFDNHSQ